MENFGNKLEMAKELFKTSYVKALKAVEEIALSYPEEKDHRNLEAKVFKDLLKKSSRKDFRFTYYVAALECGLVDASKKKKLKKIVATWEGKPPDSGYEFQAEVNNRYFELQENRNFGVQRFWVNLDLKAKKDMMKVGLEDMKSFVKDQYGFHGKWALEKVIKHVKKEMKWVLFMCRTCSFQFSSVEEVAQHLVQSHGLGFSGGEHMPVPQRIDGKNMHVGDSKLVGVADSADLICSAVESSWQSSRVKEKMDFDPDFSHLLLDKRLLKKGEIDRFDDAGVISFTNPDAYYASVQFDGGDDMFTWLMDHFPREEDEFGFPKAIGTHNFVIWVAVMRAVQFAIRTLGTNYGKKLDFLDYAAALGEARDLCDKERSLNPEGNRCATLLCSKCKEKDTSKLFLCAVRDLLKGAQASPTFDVVSPEELLSIDAQSQGVIDKTVFLGVENLEGIVQEKLALLDSKLLMTENSRIRLVKSLAKLSTFDCRIYLLKPVKKLILMALNDRLPEVA